MSNYQTSGYTHVHELLDTWKKQPQAIDSQVKRLSEKLRLIGTPSDTTEFRAMLDQDERRLHDLVAETANVSKKLFDEMKKHQKELSRDQLDLVNRVREAMKVATRNYEQTLHELKAKRQQFQRANTDTLIDFDNQEMTADDVHQRLQLQQQLKQNNLALLRQNDDLFATETVVLEVQADVSEINHIMSDIGAIVSEQSPIINMIERNVIAADDHIVAGNQQLTAGARYQRKYRGKLCCLLFVLLIIAVIITVVIVLKIRPH